MTARAFVFETEFTPSGDVLGAPASKFISRAEADALAQRAQVEAEKRTHQTAEARAYASVDRILAHLGPVADRLSAVAEELRRDAAELALAAARKIAGKALDESGDEAASAAIAEAVALLRDKPTVVVTVEPEAVPVIERRLDQLRRAGPLPAIAFTSDAGSRPGDWRVEWAEGSTGLSRDDIEAAIENAVRDRLNDPVEPQLELFSA